MNKPALRMRTLKNHPLLYNLLLILLTLLALALAAHLLMRLGRATAPAARYPTWKASSSAMPSGWPATTT